MPALPRGIEMQSVESTAVSALGYNPKTHVLVVQWVRGGLYKYSEISRDTYEAIVTSNSIGQTINLLTRSVKGTKIG